MPGVGATPPAARSAEEPLTRPPQWFDTLEERTNSEVVGERLLVLSAGHPDLLPVGSVQPGVVPHNRPGRGGPACLGRADRWALLLAHQASLQPRATGSRRRFAQAEPSPRMTAVTLQLFVSGPHA